MLALPSTAIPIRIFVFFMAVIGAMPDPSRILLAGQWTTTAPLSAIRSISRSESQTLCTSCVAGDNWPMILRDCSILALYALVLTGAVRRTLRKTLD